jgi:hypothetical protein
MRIVIAILLAIIAGALVLGPLATQGLLVDVYLIFANLPSSSVAVIVGVPGAIIGYHAIRLWLTKRRLIRDARPYLPNPRDRQT